MNYGPSSGGERLGAAVVKQQASALCTRYFFKKRCERAIGGRAKLGVKVAIQYIASEHDLISTRTRDGEADISLAERLEAGIRVVIRELESARNLGSQLVEAACRDCCEEGVLISEVPIRGA